MRIDMECIRDILLCVEKHTDLRKYCCFYDVGPEGDKVRAALGEFPSTQEPQPYQAELLVKYENDKLLYHLRYCEEAELIRVLDNSSSIRISVADLTVSGHELLGKIRDEKQWGNLKKCLSSIRDYSLAAISSAAEGIAAAGISAFARSQTGH